MRALVALLGPFAVFALLALPLAAPSAMALDVLPAESRLGDDEARLVVRAEGMLVVRTEPPILVALAGEDQGALAPRTLAANGSWRGMDGVLELRLRREHAAAAVDVYLEDDAEGGAWIEWPGSASAVSAAAAREAPGSGAVVTLATLALGAAFMRRRAARPACAMR